MTRSAGVLGTVLWLGGLGFTVGTPPTGGALLDEIARAGHESRLSAAAARVKHIGIASSATANTSSLTVSIPAGGVAAGHRLIARLSTGSGSGAVSASDSKGNAWSVDAEHVAGQLRVVVLSAHVATALTAGNTVTVTFPAVTTVALVVDEYSGIAASAAVDKKRGNGGTSATATSNAVTTTTAGQLLIGLIGSRGSSAINFQAGSGWQAETQAKGGQRFALPEYRIASAAGSFQADGALGTSAEWAALIVTYKVAAPPRMIPMPTQPTAPTPTPKPSGPELGPAPARSPTPAPGVRTLPTSTDLTLQVRTTQGSFSPKLEVYTLTQPLTFRWSRPSLGRTIAGESIKEMLTEKAQWQMSVASTPPTIVIFVGPQDTGVTSFSYGGVPVASSGETADFTLTKWPAQLPSAVVWVRVVLSTRDRLRASPWLKISIVPVPNDWDCVVCR